MAGLCSLHHTSEQETSCACAKLAGHNKEQAIIQATEPGNIHFVEATGLKYIEIIEYGLVIYCVECIFDVKI